MPFTIVVFVVIDVVEEDGEIYPIFCVMGMTVAIVEPSFTVVEVTSLVE